MEWISINEIAFYATAWSTAFLSCLFRTLADDIYVSLRRCFFLSGVSGWLGFVVVGILCGRGDPSSINGHVYYLAVAALVGLAAKQQDAIVSYLLKRINIGSNDTPTDEN